MPTGEVWEIELLFKDFEALSDKSIKSDKSAFTRVVLIVTEKENLLNIWRVVIM